MIVCCNVCEIYYRDMTKRFVAGESPRISRICCRDVPRIFYWDKTQGFVAETLRDMLQG